MDTKGLRKFAETWLTLFAVVAAGVSLNIIGGKLNALWGLPLFLDNVGTLLSALLGGFIPCITVGFFSNIIVGFTDPYTAYYCVISVMIAAAAVFFGNKRMLTRFPHILVAVTTFAFLGGVVGGLLTWLINGLSFGEGFAVDMAEKIDSVVPMGYIASNLLSVFLVDLVDKAIVTAVVLMIWFLLPKSFKHLLRRFSWYYDAMPMAKSGETRKRMSLSIKVTLLVAASTTMVSAAAIGISVVQFHNKTVQEYTEIGQQASLLIAERFDESRVEEYLTKGRSARGYSDVEDLMETVRSVSPEIKYIYIYKIEKDGTHVLFDLDTEEFEAEEPGDIIPYDQTIARYKDEMLRGKDIPVDITNDEYGWVLSVYRPIRDDSGKTLCYVGVDMSMDNLKSEEYAFLAKIISLFIGFLMVIRTYAVWMADRKIINPINRIADMARRISYDTPTARQESLRQMDALNIDTGDEIENLYHAYKYAAGETVRYIDEVEKKSAQLSRMQNGLIMVLADMVESRDQCTGDHVRKTAAYTEVILRQMQKEGIYADKLSDEYIAEVVNSAPLHDVGKIAVSDAILNKPGKLTDEEFRAMQTHTTEGGKIIDKAIELVAEETEYLTEAKNLASGHHEKWNGKGYPKGLSGEDIPLSARVMAVADVFDALVSRRSYKEPFSVEKALDIIREGSGSHFDPQIIKAFLDAEDEVRRIAAMNMDI